MAKKTKYKFQPHGNNIQIRFERYHADNYVSNGYLMLKNVALNFQRAEDDEWHGQWEGQEIWVKFTRPGQDTIFSDNFPKEHIMAAEEEVRRIERQFN